MPKAKDQLTTIRTEGSLLPADLLARVSEEDATLPGMTAASYHRSGERLNEAISRAWTALQSAWSHFQAGLESLPVDDLGTTITRERWLLPLFEKLDYGRLQTAGRFEIEGKSYPISHSWGLNVPIHLVSTKVDLDRTMRGVAGAATASPQSLLQVFLNRSDDHLWGFVSNGNKLRVLRDNLTLTRQAYVEFDLEAMMNGDAYSDFRVLWLLCHQSRVEADRPLDCWLEKWMKEAEDRGARALEHLRDGRLDKQNYYRQLLRIIYRLLFMFVAEDRDLLLDRKAADSARESYKNYYSTQRLRTMAAKFVGTGHSDLFEALRLVMRLLGGGGDGAPLGILPLGSFLFSDKAVAEISDCKISNRQLLSAVRSLSLIDDREARSWRNVDYKNLGPEDLGSVYESLLELHPHINVDARSFALRTAGGNERKTSGSYYTPSSLIKVLLDSALDPVLDETAKREVISKCIYGVDINPMAAELCKVSLWLEALDPGKPLSFLDHHIQVGNSLLGTTPRLMAEGIPNDAFKPIEGDDKKAASALRKQNRGELKQREAGVKQLGLEQAPPADYGFLTDTMSDLAKSADDSLSDIQAKEELYTELANSPEYIKARLLADAWCAAFVWVKSTPPPAPPQRAKEGSSDAQVWPDMSLTDLLYRHLEDDPQAENMQTIREQVVALTDRYSFFHWHVAFPDVFQVPEDLSNAENEAAGWNGGFDVVLGNPPWERIKIQEKEWFAQRDPDIAGARNAAERRRMIAALAESDPPLLDAFNADKRKADGESHFIRVSQRFPLCGRGDVNTYTVFAELDRFLLNLRGRVGMVCPSGIAIDDTTKYFLQDLMRSDSLASLYDFENRQKLFPAVDSRMKFALLTMTGPDIRSRESEFVFFALNVGDLDDKWRRFKLSAADIVMLNPNTGTMATFRSQRDAEITKAIYRRVPVLIKETPPENTWGITFKQGLFNMTSDSDKFHARDQLESRGFTLDGNHFVKQDDAENG